jgi:DNA-binding NarL/FixJ family response regulator
MNHLLINPSVQTITVAIVEDNMPCQLRFAQALNQADGIEVVACFVDGQSAIAWLERNSVDVLLCDLGLPDIPGLAVISYCALKAPKTDIMVASMFEDDDHVIRAIEAGATGYLLKDSLGDEIVERVRELSAGGAPMSPPIARRVLKKFRPTELPVQDLEPKKNANSIKLSPKEMSTLQYVAKGFSYAEIAKMDGVTVNTVQTFVKRIYTKLSVHSRTEAVYEAQAMGLL